MELCSISLLLSGTGPTPTHIVNYGGHGVKSIIDHHDIPSDPKLQRFIPPEVLDYGVSVCEESRFNNTITRCPLGFP